MSERKTPAAKFGNAPVIVLKAMLAEVDGLAKETTIRKLFAKVVATLGRPVSDDQLHRALFYLAQDNIVVVHGQTVTKSKSTRRTINIRTGLERLARPNPVKYRLVRIRRSVAKKMRAKKVVRHGGGFLGTFGDPEFSPGRFPIEEYKRVPEPRTYRDSPEEEFRVPIFYATDREKEGDGNYLDTGIPSGLDRGRITVVFPKSHKTGEFRAPSSWFCLSLKPIAKTELIERKRLAKSAFHNSLRAALNRHEDQMFVFVHGVSTKFDDAVARTAQIQLDTKFEGAAIAFSWPSLGAIGNYAGDCKRLTDTTLSDFLVELRVEHPTTTIHIVCHSLGAHFVAQAIKLVGPQVGASEIVLQAPDLSTVDYALLSPKLIANSSRVTVYANRRDKALLMAKKANGHWSIGRFISRAIRPGVEAIDSTSVGGDGTFWQHSYVFRRPLLEDLEDVFKRKRQTRDLLKEKGASPDIFYVFK